MDFFQWLPLMAVTGYIIFNSLANGAQYPSALYPDTKSCVKNAGENILQSTNGMFALKFFKLDNQTQYLVIAYIQYNETIIWTANRNKPIRGSRPCLKLGAESADLILQDTDGSLPWSANVSGVNRLELKDSGNLLLQDKKNVTIWVSFDYPTDTIVQGGYLGSGKALVSSISPTELSEGPYTLRMETGGVVLYASFPSPLPFGAWTYNPLGVDSSSLSSALHSACNNTILRYGSKGESINLEQALNITAECLQETQGRALSPRQIVVGAQLGNDFFRFLRLDNDGNVRTYIQSETRLTSDSDMFSIYFQDVCKLPDICGSLGICSSGGNCSCQDDIIFDKLQPKVGCTPRKNSICGASNQLLELDGVDYFANEYTSPGTASLQQCKNSCLSNCSCAAAFFFINSGGCYHYQEIKSLRRVSDQSIRAYIKVGPGSFKEIPDPTGGRKTNVLAIAVAVICIVVIVSALSFLVWRYKVKKMRKSTKSEEDEFLDNLPGLPPRFSYMEMEEVTEGFSTQLGAGGFGVVFAGQLADGTKVAVKKLGNADKGHLQFRAEVAALGSINHVNLVRLFGFCADGTNRLLVYEYMSNGSLDRWLFERRPHDNNPSPFLDWRKRYKIIHDTAQGLAFLHDKSRDRILHLDVKPQNILVDENFEAKLADFGLAKLMDRAQSRAFTRIRGTPGYLAPEWRLHACATDKSDVYSFGMVLLEIIGGRKNLDLSKPEDMQFFPSWAMSMIEEGKIKNVVDPKLGDLADYEWKQAETVIKIAFFCIQEDAKARPSMNEVILMLEGHTEVEDPTLSVEFLMRTRDRISALSCAEGIPSSAATVSIMSLSARFSCQSISTHLMLLRAGCEPFDWVKSDPMIHILAGTAIWILNTYINSIFDPDFLYV